MFSTILDISSFFIGMLINLLLIALICYYFKRKYETLEASQNEQAKILYNLIQNQIPKKTFNVNDLITNPTMGCSLNTVMVNPEELEDSDGSETDSETSDTDESDEEDNSKKITLHVSEIKEEEGPVKKLSVTEIHDVSEDLEEYDTIIVNKVDNSLDVNETTTTEKQPLDQEEIGTDYSKMSIKQLKDILTKKGINSNHRMKKTDLINLIENRANENTHENTLNLKDEIEEVNI